MAVLPTGIGASGGPPGAQVSRSLRFNSADSAYLNRTPASAGTTTTWTWSAWVKRSSLGAQQYIFYAASAGSNSAGILFNSSDQFRWYQSNGSQTITTTQVFRDTSAWYHFVVVMDTTNGTSTDRLRMYVNGSRITAFASATYPSSGGSINNNVAHAIGRDNTYSYEYFNGYITEVNFIDGQALTPSSFGQNNTNTGVWEPKAYSGTYGTNGFYLNFSDNSGTTSTTLGKDYSGNGNNWTPNNFSVTAGVGNDSLVDTPTSYGTDTGVGGEVRGNYATWNAIDQNNATINNGNLYVDITSGNARSTLGMTTGKWYWEITVGTGGSQMIGVTTLDVPIASSGYSSAVGFGYYAANGFKYNNGGASSYGSTFTQNDIIGVALDADTGKIWFAKNGTWQASGNPAAGTNAAFTASSLVGRPFAAMYETGGIQSNINANFGQRAFSYTAPSGFKALCTQNLPTPTIGATSTTQANDYFDVTLYTGNGANNRLVSNASSMNPDFVWLKARSINYTNIVFDSVRGNGKYLSTDQTGAENFAGTLGWTNSGPSTGGFVVDQGTNSSINENSSTFVGWQWKANGAGSSNTAGTITSTVSANTTSGFSIVTYTATRTSAGNDTIGHGLGIAPAMVISKSRNTSTVWIAQHSSLGTNEYLELSTTSAARNSSSLGAGALPKPTSTVFYGSWLNGLNVSGQTQVAYCFAPVAGYSAFGSYTGNGSDDGPFIYTGFRPRFIMTKAATVAGEWEIYDTARGTYNSVSMTLEAQASSAELNYYTIDILSNGFKQRRYYNTQNQSGQTFIYAAFAESPFKYSLAR